MANPYVGEIRLFGGNFAPAGWALCDGQLLAISENETLFVLIGTTYGGDGQATFALPDLRGRVPVHQGTGQLVGELGGVETVALTANQIPNHSHALSAGTSIATQTSPAGNVPAQTSTYDGYQTTAGTTAMAPQSVGPAGGSQPHENLQPYLCVNFIISLFGIFPSPT